MIKNNKNSCPDILPLLKSPELMSKVCGIGENRLRTLMDEGFLEYLPVGNRRLLLDKAVLEYYERNKVAAVITGVTA